jgi:hypothetical protein
MNSVSMQFHLELEHSVSLVLATFGYLLYMFLMVSNLLEVDEKLLSFLAAIFPLMLFFAIGIVGLHIVLFVGFCFFLRKKNIKDFNDMVKSVTADAEKLNETQAKDSRQKGVVGTESKQAGFLADQAQYDLSEVDRNIGSVKCLPNPTPRSDNRGLNNIASFKYLQSSIGRRDGSGQLNKPSQATITTHSHLSMTQFDIHQDDSQRKLSLKRERAPIEYFKLLPAGFILGKNLLDMAFLVYAVSHLVSGGITLFLTCISVGMTLVVVNFSLLDQLFLNTDDGRVRMEFRELYKDLDTAKAATNFFLNNGNIMPRDKKRTNQERAGSSSGKVDALLSEKGKSKEGVKSIDSIRKEIKSKTKHLMLRFAFVTIGNLSLLLASIGFFIRQTIMLIDKFSAVNLVIFGSTIVGLIVFALLRHKIRIDTLTM